MSICLNIDLTTVTPIAVMAHLLMSSLHHC